MNEALSGAFTLPADSQHGYVLLLEAFEPGIGLELPGPRSLPASPYLAYKDTRVRARLVADSQDPLLPGGRRPGGELPMQISQPRTCGTPDYTVFMPFLTSGSPGDPTVDEDTGIVVGMVLS